MPRTRKHVLHCQMLCYTLDCSSLMWFTVFFFFSLSLAYIFLLATNLVFPVKSLSFVTWTFNKMLESCSRSITALSGHFYENYTSWRDICVLYKHLPKYKILKVSTKHSNFILILGASVNILLFVTFKKKKKKKDLKNSKWS